jgi:hypothetical protein
LSKTNFTVVRIDSPNKSFIFWSKQKKNEKTQKVVGEKLLFSAPNKGFSTMHIRKISKHFCHLEKYFMASRRLFAVLQTIDIYSQFEITVVLLLPNPYHGMIQMEKKIILNCHQLKWQ